MGLNNCVGWFNRSKATVAQRLQRSALSRTRHDCGRHVCFKRIVGFMSEISVFLSHLHNNVIKRRHVFVVRFNRTAHTAKNTDALMTRKHLKSLAFIAFA
jgi:hypothetical protein